MISKGVIIALAIAYLCILFLVANLSERNKFNIASSWIYALSMAVYCTAWTFFGSIGNAAEKGLSFLPVYLGPTLFMPLIAPVLVKIIRISKRQRITSIADFISSRYGKNVSLGIWVTLFCVIGIVPYISIQLKAITSGIEILTGYENNIGWWQDSTLYIAAVLALFTMVYGIRHIDATEQHKGVMSAIAFESIIKLVAFLLCGLAICYVTFNNTSDIFKQAAIKNLVAPFTTNQNFNSWNWILTALVSALSILFLPRQFQVAVVENTDVNHVKKSMWVFPLYLLLINLLVIPIALAGKLTLQQGSPDNYFLLLIEQLKNPGLSALVFIGGFSAATGMVIVEVIALTTMISNHVLAPLFLTRSSKIAYNAGKFILNTRRIAAIFLLFFAYLFEKQVAERYSLISIGLISFTAMAQLAPSVLFGLFWKESNRKAAVVSILSGFLLWFYTLVIPSFKGSTWIDHLLLNGPFSISWLKPTELFGMNHLDPISHGIFWSLGINTLLFVLISLQGKVENSVRMQQELFLYPSKTKYPIAIWNGLTLYHDLKSMLARFIGEKRVELLLQGYANRHDIIIQEDGPADRRMVRFAERLLGGVVGAASSRLMISSVTTEENITLTEVMDIVKESQQIIELNKELRKKSIELEKASSALSAANEKLLHADELKNEFLYTVTHELRTPLTSIRALSEILHDNPDLEEEQRQQYLSIITREIEKLSHLITQVLNLEKYESGRQRIHPISFEMKDLLQEVMDSLYPLAQEKNKIMLCNLPNEQLLIHADRSLLVQVVYNLVSNAIKFAHEKIEILIRKQGDELEVQICDDGPGIDEFQKDLLFDKFYQYKQHHLLKPEGSGLGLAICRRIIELHHGKISARNNVTKGASFIFVLPSIYQE